jgi:hypothetical protein
MKRDIKLKSEDIDISVLKGGSAALWLRAGNGVVIITKKCEI